MSEFLEKVTKERKRQIEKEGFTADHDAQHHYGELAMAAACMAATEDIFVEVRSDDEYVMELAWPWPDYMEGRHKHDRKRQLVIAAALLEAEWDRLTAEEREESK